MRPAGGALDHDVVVIGAGLAGAATAWQAAGRGLNVLVLEQFGPDHDRGSSHGSARIVRRAYADALYTQLTGRAFELWREAELAAGATLLNQLGALDFGPERRVDQIVANLSGAGVAHEVLSPTEAMHRWPGMFFDTPVVHHSEAGTVDAETAVTTFLDLARGHGAQVRFDQPVTGVSVASNHASTTVRLGEREIRARAVVLTAGAWLPDLTRGMVLDPVLPELSITQEQTFHFPRTDPSQDPWPSTIHAAEGFEIYHLSGGRDGGAGLDRKVAEHHHGRPASATGRDGLIDPAGTGRVQAYVRRWLPGLDPEPANANTCLYTTTPTQNFLVDRIGPVVLCSACSGHGAKFAPLIGEWTTALLTGTGRVPERFALAAHGPGARRSWSL